MVSVSESDAAIAAPYRMRLSLNVLNHLGIYLYSNSAAVLSEVVANAWDADATKVAVKIDQAAGSVSIHDDGCGMTLEDVNNKYLLVGYQKRANEPERTPKGRLPMGRKGIGKLSLFSIAKEVLIETIRDGEKNALRMTLEGIERAINNETGDGVYLPVPESIDTIDFERGTRITLTRLKKQLYQTPTALRRRLARRFAVIGEKNDFDIELDSTPIGISDRDYFHKIQFLWTYNDDDAAAQCSNIEHIGEEPNKAPAIHPRPFKLALPDTEIRGWIGTVREAGQLKDDDGENLNKITVMMRGKLAHEDILEDFSEGGLYTKYLIGEIQADFLDENSKEDIATSSRQAIMEDDERYLALRSFIHAELRHIESRWTELRNQKGEEEALKIPAIEKWFKELGPDNRKRARSLFGRINQLTLDEPSRRRLLKFGVLAFENLKLKEKLDSLDSVSLSDIDQVVSLFGELADIEATFYHQIISQRVQVIRKFQEAVDQNAREKVIQEHVFEHLWLLDPGWERATNDEFMEQRVGKIFGEIDAGLTDEEKAGRLDIKYKMVSGKHIVVELKRAGRVVSTPELLTQIMKYHSAITKVLRESNRTNEPFEFLCVVGKNLSDWIDDGARERTARTLEAFGARVLMYDELMSSAYKAYNDFLSKQREAGRLMTLITSIEIEEPS